MQNMNGQNAVSVVLCKIGIVYFGNAKKAAYSRQWLQKKTAEVRMNGEGYRTCGAFARAYVPF